MEIMSTPRSVELEITSGCNLRCRYCSHFSSPGDVDKELAGKDWLVFFGECRDLGVMNILLSGGEPFLRKDIKEIIAGIIENRMRFSINSNGSLITQDLARFLASSHRCDSVQLSIDGHCAEIHDSCRGQGSFTQAVTGLENLRKYHVPVSVRVTIHRNNVAFLDDITRFILYDLELPGFSTNAAMFMGLMRKNADKVQLSVEQYSHAMQTLLKLNKKYDNRINATAGPLADARCWSYMVKSSGEKALSSRGAGTLSACGCAESKIAVRADGAIVPCSQLGGYTLGKINQDSLKQIWQSSLALNRFRNRKKIELSRFEECRECDYIRFCRGGCPALVYGATKSVFMPSTVDCLKAFFKKGGRLPAIAH